MATASPSQELVYEEVRTGKGNIAIQATAGSGKTTLLLGCLEIVPRLKKTIFLSFSNAIVDELKARAPQHVKVSTLHSIGNRFIKSRFKDIKLDQDKYFKFALEMYTERNKAIYKKCFDIQTLCNYARLTLSDFSEEDLQLISDKYCVDVDLEQVLIASIILVENANLKRLRSMDFTDMVYLPAVYSDLVNETFDYVFWDEAQDAGRAQMILIKNILRPIGGRLIFCGDERQAIFGFIGSDIDSFSQIEKLFKSTRMALTVTFRVPKRGVELAQTIYPDDIEAHPDAIDGIVRRGELIEASQGDMVICRNNKPLISAFFYFISRGIKSFIVGKDLEKGLIKLAESVQGYTHEAVKQRIEDKLDAFLVELEENGVSSPEKSPKYEALLEKSEILLVILEKCDSAAGLIAKISDIFHEDKKAIKLISAHKSKGMESDRVFFIELYNKKKLLPSEYAVLPWQKIQEENLTFVVYTRFKKEFVFVEYED